VAPVYKLRPRLQLLVFHTQNTVLVCPVAVAVLFIVLFARHAVVIKVQPCGVFRNDVSLRVPYADGRNAITFGRISRVYFMPVTRTS